MLTTIATATVLSLFNPSPAPKTHQDPPKPPVSVIKPAQLVKAEYIPYPYSPMGTYSNTYAPRNCTSYVASRKKIPNSWSHAKFWAVRAKAMGITVSNTPIIGSIAQHSRGSAGHVALVLNIQGDSVYIAEQNYNYRGSIREAWKPISMYVYIWI